MDIRSNEPFWLIRNEFVKSYPSLEENLSAEILVIGAGITGALIAYQLIQEGKNVIMVDRRDVCNGSSAASTAMLQYEIDVPLYQLIEMRGHETAAASYRECEKSIFKLKKIAEEIKSDCHFEFKKSIWFTSEKKKKTLLENEFEARKAHQFDVNWLDEQALTNLGVNAKFGIESLSGAVVDPYKLSNDLLKWCSLQGMKIYDRTEISKIKQKKKYMLAATRNGKKIKAEHIIQCTGYESVSSIGKGLVDLKSTYAVASEAFEKLPPAFQHHIYWNTDSPYLYFRATSDGRIIAGGGDENFKNAEKRDALLPKKMKYLAKEFQKCFPGIHFKPDYAWAGTFGETTDGLPYIGKPNQNKNEHFVLGFGGNGITYSVMAMDAIIPSLENRPHEFLNYYHFNR